MRARKRTCFEKGYNESFIARDKIMVHVNIYGDEYIVEARERERQNVKWLRIKFKHEKTTTTTAAAAADRKQLGKKCTKNKKYQHGC